MTYQPAPVFTADNVKGYLLTAAKLVAIGFAIWLLGLIADRLFPDFAVPRWVAPAVYGAYLIAQTVLNSRDDWLTDDRTVDFKTSFEMQSGRVGSLLFAAVGAIILLYAYATYPE